MEFDRELLQLFDNELVLTWTEDGSLLHILEVFEVLINAFRGLLSHNFLQVFVLDAADHELCRAMMLIA